MFLGGSGVQRIKRDARDKDEDGALDGARQEDKQEDGAAQPARLSARCRGGGGEISRRSGG